MKLFETHSPTCIGVAEIIDAQQLVVSSSQQAAAVLRGEAQAFISSPHTGYVQEHLDSTRHCTDLSEVDSLDDVFVRQREDLVSTHCIPHLSGKHRGRLLLDNCQDKLSLCYLKDHGLAV